MAGNLGQGATQAKPREAGTPLIKDATTATFGADVLTESAQQPVLVDFWAPWCEPCKQLTPILEKVVKAAGGKVKLVKMNIDEHPQIPGRLGVRSIPAVIAFQKSQPIDGFMGALPESQLRGFIERLVGPIGKGEDVLAEAEALLVEGRPDTAAEIYVALIAENPNDLAAVAGLAKVFLATGELDSARKILADVPASGQKDAAIIGAKAMLALAEQVAQVGNSRDLARKLEADPGDHQARLDLATLLNAESKREDAAAALLEIIKRDRAWNDEAARKQLLQFFEAWGPMDPATIGARKKLSALLFS
jgi:putative thioredoxin